MIFSRASFVALVSVLVRCAGMRLKTGVVVEQFADSIPDEAWNEAANEDIPPDILVRTDEIPGEIADEIADAQEQHSEEEQEQRAHQPPRRIQVVPTPEPTPVPTPPEPTSKPTPVCVDPAEKEGLEPSCSLEQGCCPWPYSSSCGAAWEKYPPYLIGAVYGLAGCAGISGGFPPPNVGTAQAAGCPVVPSLDEATPGDVTVATSVGMTNMLFAGSAGGGGSFNGNLAPNQYPLDLVPWHFSWPLKKNDQGVPESMQWSDFEFERTDGSIVKPWGVTLAPQVDGKEGFTVLTATPSLSAVGSPATGGGIAPLLKTARVVGSLIVTNGTHDYDVQGTEFSYGSLNYDSGPVLVQAWSRSYEPELNFNYTRENSNSMCPPHPETTHVVTVAGIGGLSIDGVNQFFSNQTGLFTIRLKDGSELPREYFKLIADLDGDDLTDVCLQLPDGVYSELYEVGMVCDMDDLLRSFSLPKGREGDGFGCECAQPQKISQVQCPDAAVCR